MQNDLRVAHVEPLKFLLKDEKWHCKRASAAAEKNYTHTHKIMKYKIITFFFNLNIHFLSKLRSFRIDLKLSSL